MELCGSSQDLLTVTDLTGRDDTLGSCMTSRAVMAVHLPLAEVSAFICPSAVDARFGTSRPADRVVRGGSCQCEYRVVPHPMSH